MDKYIGKLLDGRYEILEEIGVGGMSVVYKAMCNRLNRLVAVKILKDDLSEDDELRKRFEMESQAIAMMSHPNIVNVSDVSISDDVSYIVMELIEGISLKQYLETKGVLSWREVLHFSTQIAKALEHAHSKGVIHRDIKPHNVMILKDGSIKVADFGIASIASVQEEPSGEAFGSVHYISPEQAKGERVDNRTDIYSLGIVMYEMLTGRPPYDGETPVSVAVQHINGTPVKPSLLAGEIPAGLEQIAMHAMCSDLDSRYASATEMLADLEAFRKDPQIQFDFSFGVGEPGRVISAAAAEPVEIPEAAGREQSLAEAEKDAQQRAQAHEKEKKRRKFAVLGVCFCAAVVLVGLLILILHACQSEWKKVNTDGILSSEAPRYTGENASAETERAQTGSTEPENRETETVEQLPVPKVESQKYDEDLIGLYSEMFGFCPEYEYNETVPADVIIAQDPAPDTGLPRGGVISVTVSKGPKPRLPELTGKSAHFAKETLAEDVYGEISISYPEEYSDTVEAGYVIRTEPEADTLLEKIGNLKVVVSLGPEIIYVEVPEFDSRTGKEEAVAKLAALKLKYDLSYSYSDSVPENNVISQSPPAGSKLEEGKTVSLVISKGKELYVVPSVIGMEKDRAVRELEDLHFTVTVVEEEDVRTVSAEGIAEGTVTAQSVDASAECERGTRITITVAVKPKPISVPNLIGKTVGEATEILTGLGLKVMTKPVDTNDYPPNSVVEQSPAADSELYTGEYVWLYYANPVPDIP